MKIYFIAGMALLGLAGARPSASQQPVTPPLVPEIRASGSGEMTLRPDWALLHIGIESHANSAARASSDLSRRVAAVRDTLRKLGFAADSIQMSRFAIGPNYEYSDGRKLVDYQGTGLIRVTVRKLESVGAIVDAALAAGATDIPIITYQSAVADSGRRVALARALEEARKDAMSLAQASGGSLGQLIEVSTVPDNGIFAMMGGRASNGMEAASIAMAPSDVMVRVEVQTRWRLEAGR